MKTLLPLLLLAALPMLSSGQGTIIEDSLMMHLTAQDIDDLLASAGLPSGILPLEYEVDVHRIVYDTPDPNGNPTYASGLVFIPTEVECPMPLFTYLHGTKSLKTQTFYYFQDEWFLGAVMASSGYVTSMPDYLGLGFSPGLHPYQHARSEATASVDLLRVARTICSQGEVELNDQLFITGYSQGGHAALATHRMIQEELSDEFTVTACAPGSGPYDMSGHQFDMVAEMEPYSVPGYLPYVILSYQSIYGGFYDDYSEIFTAPYDETLPPLFNGEYGFDVINAAMPEIPRLIINPDYEAAFFSDPDHPFMLALRDNDVYDWVPEAPVLFNYCTSDEEVTYLNTIFTIEHMEGLGAENIESANRSDELSHYECANPSLLFSKVWFDGMVQWCPAGVDDISAELNIDIFPNPVTEGQLRLTNQGPVQVVITDVTGREMQRSVASTDNATIALTFAGQGLYVVTVSNDTAQKVQRIMVQ
jgi:hypothetical protein